MFFKPRCPQEDIQTDKDIDTDTDIGIQMFTATLFIIVKKWATK